MSGGRSGNMMAADYDILKAASNDIFGKKKKNDTYDPYADEPNFDSWNKKPEGEGKSMRELMAEKMNKMGPTKKKEEEKSNVESVEERKARLKAQREALLKKKQEEREKELQEAREGKSDNKYSNNLFKEFLALDKKVSKQEQMKRGNDKPKAESPEIKPEEDDEATPISTKQPKKDMASLFDDSDDDAEVKKKAEEQARRERALKVMKEAAKEQ